MSSGDTNEVAIPRLVFESEQVAVFDDFLDPDAFLRVLAYCAGAQYHSVHATGWRKVWRANDGYPLQGGTVYWVPPDAESADTPPKARYPVGADIDLFIDRLVSVISNGRMIIGTPGRDWTDFTVAPWIYPCGSALSLHQDGFRYSGAFTYFAHRSWNIHWGIGWIGA